MYSVQTINDTDEYLILHYWGRKPVTLLYDVTFGCVMCRCDHRLRTSIFHLAYQSALFFLTNNNY